MNLYDTIVAHPDTCALITDHELACDTGKQAKLDDANALATYALRLDVDTRVQFARGVFETCGMAVLTHAWGDVCSDPEFARAVLGDKPPKPDPVVARLNGEWSGRPGLPRR